jgi:redox-sensitive bicupin YhaK (pirin superfamily)
MTNFGSLRVINEDRVKPTKGFGVHSHREMEIFSYIVSGELEHQDSMGNLEIMKRGDVQVSPPIELEDHYDSHSPRFFRQIR